MKYYRINKHNVFTWSGIMLRHVHSSILVARSFLDCSGFVVYESRSEAEHDICQRYGELISNPGVLQ